MAGIWLSKEYLARRNKNNNKPYRSSGQGGVRGCLGAEGDPFPGDYHPKNCNGKRMNQRY